MIGVFKRMFILMFVLGLGTLTLVSCSNADVAGDGAASVVAKPTLEEVRRETDGQIPEAAEPSDSKLALDWCSEHSVPESVCTVCNPGLIDGFKESGDWCGGHGIPESHCRLCNPEIVFPQEIELNKVSAPDWCFEHSLPESVCTFCNPSLIAGFKESGDWCGGHDMPESLCKLCNPEIVFPQELELNKARAFESEEDIEVSLFHRSNATVCATDGALIQFASNSIVERAGISVQRAYSSRVEKIIDAPAEVVFNEASKYVVSSTVPALVSRWFVSPGDFVEKGAPLAVLQSPDLPKLKSALVNAHVNYEIENKELARHSQMRKRNLISEVDFDRQHATTEQARVALVSSRGMLLSVGLSADDIDEVIEQGKISNTFSLTAASSGVVVERKAQLGELLEPGSAFAILADPGSMWIEANLSEAQLRDIEVGQTLTFMSDGKGLNRVGAEVIWVSRFLDQHTRTGTVRARVLDADHRLQAGEFGRVKIFQFDEYDVTIIPKDAVQWEGCCNVVFVKETDQRYRPRKIQFIDGDGDTYQVINGVTAGEEIVVGGAFLLKTELKKSSIGAGCCEVKPAG